MGKTNNLFTGIVRKKVGSLVGYRITNSNNGEKQGLRTYVANPKNPKSLAQAIQRCKLGPASRFYRAFSDILDHAFEGVAIGQPSRSHFMSLAMQSATPAVAKGDTSVPVFPYIVSQGSLPFLPLIEFENGNASCPLVRTDEEIPGSTQIGAAVSKILSYEGLLQQGDEITFVGVMLPLINGRTMELPVAFSHSFVLDPTITDTIEDAWHTQIGNFGFSAADGYVVSPKGTLLAGAFIISRRDGDNWLYTNSQMKVTTAGEQYYNDALVEAAVRSYMDKSDTKSSELILQQANNGISTSAWVVNADGFVVLLNESNQVVRLAKGKTQAGDVLPIIKISGEFKVTTGELPTALANVSSVTFANPFEAKKSTGIDMGTGTYFASYTPSSGGSEGGADVRP
jgi:hypothetical protein